MPGSVTITEKKGQPTSTAGVDFTMCIVGTSSTSPLAAGLVSPLYADPTSAATDYGVGDGIDALTQAVSKTTGNPSPPPAAFYRTPQTTPGAYGTLVVTGVTGTSVVTTHAATHPFGTYQVVGKVITGGTIGVAGIVLQFSLDNGRTWLPAVALGTATTILVNVPGPVSTGVQFDFAAGTLVANDTWSVPTTPPLWADADLYSGGATPSGAFVNIGASTTNFGMIVISEPIGASDFSTLTGGLNYLGTLGKKPALIVRFRDPNSGESDAAYITAYQTFAASNQDDRISICVGSCLLTDALSGRIYLRSFLPALLARLQSFAGKGDTRIARNPGYVADGSLENVSLVDSSGNIIGHDETVRAGIEAANGICLYRIPNPSLNSGAYVVSSTPTLYPNTSKILTLMDRRIANAIERDASAILWTAIGGTVLYDSNNNLLPDVQEGLAASVRNVISRTYKNEIQNPDDPALVTINAPVTLSGPNVTITGNITPKLFGYAYTINITFGATR